MGKGTQFPMAIDNGPHMTATPDGKSLILSAGHGNSKYQKHLYRFQCSGGITKCQWEKLPVELQYARNYHSSVFLPETEYPCNRN